MHHEFHFPTFHHRYPVQLRFNDIDTLGHVNNSIYFTFYDLGKSRYFEAVRQCSIDWRRADVVIANINADFISPIYPCEEIAVETCTIEIGHRSFTLLQRLINVESNEIKGICRTVMVGFDIAAGVSAPISDEWKEALCQYEHADLCKSKQNMTGIIVEHLIFAKRTAHKGVGDVYTHAFYH